MSPRHDDPEVDTSDEVAEQRRRRQLSTERKCRTPRRARYPQLRATATDTARRSADEAEHRIREGMQSMIGVFGGSGFYEFLDDAREVEVDTPYGEPARRSSLAQSVVSTVAFLPRHGHDHQFPAHKVPFRANVWA